MPREVFFVPMIGTGTRDDPFREQYGDTPGLIGGGSIRYSRQSSAIAMFNGPQAVLDSIAAQPNADRWVAEADLNTEIGGSRVPSLSNTLEAEGIPANFISANDNWRQTIRAIAGILLFAQRHEGLNGTGFFADLESAGADLNTQWRNLPPAFQATIQATIDDHGWAISPDPNQQVRSLLRAFSDQFNNTTISIGGLEI